MAEATRRQPRSWLFAPGHVERYVRKALDSDADAVLLDLEDAVPPDLKVHARQAVQQVATERRFWVRINPAGTVEAERDIEAVGGIVAGLRVPKVQCANDVLWVAERAPRVPLDCTIESARGVVAAAEIASAPGCDLLSFGGIDFAADIGIGGGLIETVYARSAVVVAARAAGRPAPSDGVFPNLEDNVGLRRSAEDALRLGFCGKAAIHPKQVSIINEVFATTEAQLAWAKRVIAAFEASAGQATKLDDGEFIDLAVVRRARQLLGGPTA